MTKQYIQYGCGLSAPKEWLNFDASPTLRIQKIPLIGWLLNRKLNVVFPSNVQYGNIISGLPVKDNSCDGLYCSHVLEHLSLQDFRIVLRNSYKILKPGGIFRCVVPDLEIAAKKYLSALENGNDRAGMDFVGGEVLLYPQYRNKGIKGLINYLWANSRHLWAWDIKSLSAELEDAGFTSIRPCKYHDCEDEMFQLVEDEGRFLNAVAIECKK